MQKETSILSTLTAQEDVLLKKVNKQQYLTSKSIISQAKTYAKHIVSEAFKEVEIIKQASYREGYERGLLMSIDAVTSFLDNKKQLTNDICRQLHDEIKILLTKAVNQENVIVALFENWIDSIDKKEGHYPFYILLPDANRRYKSRLMSSIDKMHGCSAIFEFHQDSHYVFKYGEHLVEFSPEVFVDSQTEALLVNHDVYAASEKLSTEALYRLYEQIQIHFPLDENMTLENDQ